MPNRELVGVILAGGQGKQLSILSQHRAIASVPFAGKYRIIDFTLSNCVNSDIFKLLVFTQYRPLSLHDHIGNGKPWDLDRLHGGIRIVSPYLGRTEGGWDRGTADAVYQNLEELQDDDSDNVLVLGGDHVYKMDYRPMLDLHLQTGADVTVGVHRIPAGEGSGSRFGILSVDDKGLVTDFEEKPDQPKGDLASMGIYIFNKEVLFDRLIEDAADSSSNHDFGRNILPKMIKNRDKVYAYKFEGYWQDVGTIQSYWEANMALLEDKPKLDLYGRDWVIYTRSEERAPAVVHPGAKVQRSLISHGCQIRGQVIHSVLSPGVVVEEGAVVRDSVIMVDTVIGKGSVVDRAIIDKEVVVGANSVIGNGDDNTPNGLEPDRINSGITLVGKRAELPDGVKIGRNCVIGSNVTPEHFKNLELASGESVRVNE
jgi:glucose-1-phosphate adenylyltransferase